MRFMPIGRPIRPRPMIPIFLEAAADSKEYLLESDGREARQCYGQKEETIVTELRPGSSEQRESSTDWIRWQKSQTREGNSRRGASHLSSSRLSTMKSMGFDMQALQPDCRNFCWSVTMAWAVTAMIGTAANPGCWRIQVAREMPSSLPSCTFSKTAAGFWPVSRPLALPRSSALRTAYPCASSQSQRSSRLRALSSTPRMGNIKLAPVGPWKPGGKAPWLG